MKETLSNTFKKNVNILPPSLACPSTYVALILEDIQTVLLEAGSRRFIWLITVTELDLSAAFVLFVPFGEILYRYGRYNTYVVMEF